MARAIVNDSQLSFLIHSPFIAFGNPCSSANPKLGNLGAAMFSVMCKFSNCNFLNRQKSFDKGPRKTIAIEAYIVRVENTVKNLIGRKATIFPVIYKRSTKMKC